METVPSKWPKITIAIVGMVLLAAIVIVSIVRDRIVNYPQNQVSVTGQGRVSYQPDVANVNVGVQIDKAAKAEDALNQLNDKINKIVAAVKRVGIATEDIQTQNYSLYPQYDYGNNPDSKGPTLTGYSANQQLLIKVRNIKDNSNILSQVIGEATKAGGNQINGVSFDVSNIDELKQEARLKAIDDARGKTQKMADTLGVKLGKLVGWWENVVQAPGQSTSYYDGKGGMGGAVNASVSPTVPSGSQEIVIEVNLNYQVK